MASDRLQRRLGHLLDEAEEAITQLDWVVVQARAQAVLAIDPENGDGLAFLATAERALATSAPVSIGQAPTSVPAILASTPDQPRSFATGRYQVKRFLGEGGKKKVYLAHDTTLDREVAFALIKTEGLDEISRTRIQREAQAMGRLGSHPHIVTVFDLGDEQDQPYMVTELMGGGDVEGAIETATDHRLPLEQSIKIAQETCRGMEFAHGRGIVHRDLKPGNVWLTSDGIAKIGDFGLAVALDRSRLTTEGMMVGTVSYMPPEQAMGGEVAPRSDLYSLGAMLYEMVTGRPPFLGDDSVAIIGQHINTPPVAPTWHNGNCPRPLEALIMRLLAKDPAERPESAADALAALDGIDLTEAPSLVKGDGGISDPHALDSLAGGVFVGRHQEMGDLKAALEETLSGRGRLLTLAGEPGIGKSRTAQELATYAGLRHAQVLWGRCYEGEGAPPYWPWVQAIRSYVRDKDPDELRAEMGAGAADIAGIVSDVSEKLPDLAATPELEPEQARFRLFDSLTAFLKNASQLQPLVLVLDDLHWADQPSLLLLEFVARELANSRLLIIGTYRDMELSRRHPLSLTLGELNRERLFQRVLLRGLAQEDVGRFIELVSGMAPPLGMVEAVHRQTEGNPLFVTEVVRLLVQEGELTPERAGHRDSWNVRIPEGVREVIGRRLDRLSERCNETLTIASVIGREFTLEHLMPLVEEITEDRLLEVLEEALAARVIEELTSSVGRYQFTHALIQETLSGELSTTRKVRLHARIAETLAQYYGDDAESHAAELAHHFSEAEAVLGTENLTRYSLLAGELALASYAWSEAQVHFERGLVAKGVPLTGADPPVDAEAADFLFGYGRARIATSERQQLAEIVDTLTRAFDYYIQAGDMDHAVAVAVHPIRARSGYRTARPQMLARALELVPADSHAAGRLLSHYGLELGLTEGDYEDAQEAISRALAIAEREDDIALELRTLVNSSTVGFYFLRYHQSLEKSLRAIDLARSANDPYAEVSGHVDAARALHYLGEIESVKEHAIAALTLAERLRDHSWLELANRINGSIAKVEGDWSAARGFNDRGLAIAPRGPALLFDRVELEYQVGDFVQGEAHLARLLEVMRLNPAGSGVEHAAPALVIPWIIRITGVMNQVEVAEAAAETILSSPHSTLLFAQVAKVGLGLLAVVRNDVAAAKQQKDALDLSPGLEAMGNFASGRVMGLLAQTMGNLEEAASYFEQSLAFCHSAGCRPELAWTCCDYADMLRDRDAEGDRAKAITLLDESLAISGELGMRPLMERVLSRREILKA